MSYDTENEEQSEECATDRESAEGQAVENATPAESSDAGEQLEGKASDAAGGNDSTVGNAESDTTDKYTGTASSDEGNADKGECASDSNAIGNDSGDSGYSADAGDSGGTDDSGDVSGGDTQAVTVSSSARTTGRAPALVGFDQTPEQYAQGYRMLSVQLFGDDEVIDVRPSRIKYQSGDLDTLGDTLYAAAKAAVDAGDTALKDNLEQFYYSKSKVKSQIEYVDRYHFLKLAHLGKGSSEDFCMTLATLAYVCRHRRDEISKRLSRSAFGGQAPEKDALPAALEAYVVAHMGLDCNGFVGNYCRASGLTRVGPQILPQNFVTKMHTDLARIGARDVLFFPRPSEDAKFRHITIIDTVEQLDDGSLQLTVTESAQQSKVYSGLFHTTASLKQDGTCKSDEFLFKREKDAGYVKYYAGMVRG